MTQYQNLLEAALENRAYRVDNDVSAQLRAFAHDLARARAGARDVIHIQKVHLGS